MKKLHKKIRVEFIHLPHLRENYQEMTLKSSRSYRPGIQYLPFQTRSGLIAGVFFLFSLGMMLFSDPYFYYSVPAGIQLPKSTDYNYCTLGYYPSHVLYLTKDNRFFLHIMEHDRENILTEMEARYSVNLSDHQRGWFVDLPYFGSDLRTLPSGHNQLPQHTMQSGIPLANGNIQLSEWLMAMKKTDRRTRIRVYADMNLSSQTILKVFSSLQDANFLRFQIFVTPSI